MLTRLTLAILDYAVNDPQQYSKRTKQVELSLDKDGELVAADSKGAAMKITATIPIDEPSSSLMTLDKSAAYGAFLEHFSKMQADALLKKALERLAEAPKEDKRRLTEVNELTFWKSQKAKDYPGLEKVLQFVLDNKILPQNVPSEDMLNGPAAYEQKGAASSGLQMLEQRLKAAVPQ